MIDPITLMAFVPASLALNLTPGADMMYALGQGLKSGRKSAVAASAGISMGGLIHVLLAGLGLGGVVAALPWAFEVIRWVGVAYLLYLAWGAFCGSAVGRETPMVSTGQAFRKGLMVNLTNPKVILFVLAFIPQFVDPTAGPILPQFLVLGAIISFGGFFINGAVGVFAGSAAQILTESKGAQIWLGRVSGTIFAGLAMRLAVMERA
ncbi:MAG: LysE family translocator [Rhodobacteraceae bacterium]|nr:LysE family translocator [Paracoccaceae bacterium]